MRDDVGRGAVQLPLANRFLTAQMWWIGSELVRRHPYFAISMVELDDRPETRHSVLIVHDEPEGLGIQFDLAGEITFLDGDTVRGVTWGEVFAAPGPLEIVQRLEAGVGVGSPAMTPVTTPHGLVYRMIASALSAALDDRHEWCAVPAPITVEDIPGSPGGPLFEGFPSTAVPRGNYASMLGVGCDHQPFWALLRDAVPVAIFDTAGVAHTVMGSTPLMEFYEEFDRELSLITARILGPYLP